MPPLFRSALPCPGLALQQHLDVAVSVMLLKSAICVNIEPFHKVKIHVHHVFTELTPPTS